MIYLAYEALRRSTRPVAWLLDKGQQLARDERNPMRDTVAMRALATAWEMPARALKDYGKPKYEVFKGVEDLGTPVEAEVIHSLPFADLLRFDRDSSVKKPKLLIAAALSGHHATLLQDTIRGFSRDFDTYITDWKDAKQVPLAEGDFGFDDYAEHLMTFLEVLGPGTHVVATCQAAPPLMGGPIDTRVSPNVLTKLTEKVPFKLFKTLNVHKVPPGYPGSGRRVYPGFYQLTGFIALNPKPHIRQYTQFPKNSMKGDTPALEKFRDFYDEYFAVLDMAEAFYLDTLQKVFFEHHIPTGKMEFRGKLVDFASVKDLPLLTVEGENDNFCPPGQTQAAQDVFSGIPEAKRKNYIQPGVGHYGVFSGSRFQADIYPVIRDFIHDALGVEPKQEIPLVQ